MIIIKSGPEEGLKAGEGLRLVAAMLGMDHIPIIVFMKEGVRCLLRGAYGETGGEYLKTAADLAGINVLSDSLEDLGGIEAIEPELGAKLIDIGQLASMMVECNVIATF